MAVGHLHFQEEKNGQMIYTWIQHDPAFFARNGVIFPEITSTCWLLLYNIPWRSPKNPYQLQVLLDAAEEAGLDRQEAKKARWSE